MAQITITIDQKQVEVSDQTTILKAAHEAGIYIPSLCFHPDLPPGSQSRPVAFIYQGEEKINNTQGEKNFEGCKLCLVEVAGQPDPIAACHTPVSDGMVIVTGSDKIKGARKRNLKDILARHPHACLTCAQGEGCSRSQCSSNVPDIERCCPQFGNCELQKVAEYIGIREDTPRWQPTRIPLLDQDPLSQRNYNLCIGCTRCVRACRDLRGIEAIGFVWDNQGQVRVGTVGPGLKDSACKFCTACVEVCPTGAIMDKDMKAGQKVASIVTCSANCPAGIDVPNYVRMIAQGRPGEALAVIREKVPLPAVLGRVCIHPCETACRRGKVNDPISICALKRFAADKDDGLWENVIRKRPASGRKVAVIGAGPAGLSVAFFLAKQGHEVTLFEERSEPGGMLSYGIPEYRLPKEVLEADLRPIWKMGVRLKVNTPIRSFGELKKLKEEGYEVVFISPGAQQSRRISLPGSDLPGVYLGMEFLRSVREGNPPALSGTVVVVIGGGDAALDSARTALRLGAESVKIVYRRTRDEMPAYAWELEEALKEGVQLFISLAPVRILGEKGVAGIEVAKSNSIIDDQGRSDPISDMNRLQTIEADGVILAIGQTADLDFLGGSPVVEFQKGLVQIKPETGETGIPWVFAGGDVAIKSGSVIGAIASGRKAAAAIDRFFGGTGNLDMALVERPALNPFLGRDEGFAAWSRRSVPNMPLEEREGNFKEVALGFSDEAAQEEAKRCLQCDLRLAMSCINLPPEKYLLFDAGHVAQVPEGEGVFQLLDEKHEVLVIKGTMNLRETLLEQMEKVETAKFFEYEENKMYSKRESELLQQYLQKYGKMPGGDGADELDDLF